MFFARSYIPYYKRNLKVAIPVVISQVGQVTVMLADNIMVGWLGPMELAAVSFAGSIYVIGMVFGLGFSVGLTPLVGLAYGEDNFRKVSSFFQNSLFLNVLSTIFFMTLMFVVSNFLGHMGQEQIVVDLAYPYYNILVWSFLPQMVFFSGKHFAEGIGNTKVAMYITLGCNLLNVVLNYLLIYGKFGFPEMGVRGAAIATLISRVCMALWIIGILWSRITFRRYFMFFRKEKLSLKRIQQLVNISVPISLQIGIETLTFSLCGIMVGWVGGISLAANQVAQTMTSLTFMMALGIASATTIRVSHQLGAKNYEGARKAGFASMHLVLAFMSVAAFCFIMFRNQLPLIFNDEPELVAIASQLFIIAGIFQLFDGLQVVSMAALRGMADTKIPMIISFVSYVVVCLSVGYVLAFVAHLGAAGVWIGYIAGLSVAAIWLTLRFNRKSRALCRGGAKHLSF